MIPLGLSTAAGMRMSRALGSGRCDLLRPIGLGAFAMTWIAMGFFAFVLTFWGQEISSWFVSDAEVILVASQLLVIAAFFQIFDGTQVVGSGSLRGLSDVKVPTFITGVAYTLIATPISYLFGARGIGPQGVWVGLAIGLAIAAVALFLRFLRLTREGAAIPITTRPADRC
jgi:MATE family multidrug resistance protein